MSSPLDEWTIVTKNDRKCMKSRPRSKKKAALPLSQLSNTEDDDTASSSAERKQKVLKLIESYVISLKQTTFYQNLREKVEQQEEKAAMLICYGVGNFASQSAPRWQLACMLCLRQLVLKNDDSDALVVQYYDPCMTRLERDVLQFNFDVHVLDENERGCRSVNDTPTLFFMPHCPQVLYHNVLVSNWSTLSKVTILGNSLHAYDTNVFGKKTMSGIRLLLPFLQEQAVQCSKHDLQQEPGLETAFNDLYFVSVDTTSISTLPSPAPSVVHVDDELV